MQLKDVMTRKVEVATPAVVLADAAKKMARYNIGLLPVCDHERVIGALTDHDITVRATAAGRDPNKTRVRDVMTRDVVTCFEDDDLSKAARVMGEKQIRRLIVVDHNRRLMGVVSLTDLVLRSIE